MSDLRRIGTSGRGANCVCRGRDRACASRRVAAQGGFAYLALLILLAIISVTAAAEAELGAVYQRRMAERELLAVGNEYQRALLSYGNATPLGQPTQPRTLDDLVRDPRYPNVVRHLRKLYPDPMTGKNDWVLVMAPDGQTIVGLHSASTGHPIQIARFPAQFQGFEDKKSYTEWVFFARTPVLTQGARPTSAGDGSGNALPAGGAPTGGLPMGGSSSNGSPFNSAPTGNGSSNSSPFGSSPFGGSSTGSGAANGSPFGGSSFGGSTFNNSPGGGFGSGNGNSNGSQ
ncbi:type II secretion system protein [Paraburkholderia jirisanensis]